MNNIPKELKAVIDSESIDFFVYSKRNYTRKKAFPILFFALIWNGFIGFLLLIILMPLFKGEELHFKSNGVNKIASVDNLEPLLVPGLGIGLFVLIGIGVLIWGLMLLFQKGGYFVGTETRLIKFRKGNFTITDWEQFSGNIKMKSKSLYGDLTLELRTGKMVNKKNSSNRFVPNVIHMAGIKDVIDIEKKCRKRIKENDPTPSTSVNV